MLNMVPTEIIFLLNNDLMLPEATFKNKFTASYLQTRFHYPLESSISMTLSIPFSRLL